MSNGGIGLRGRHGKMDMVDGDLMEVRKVLNIGGSHAIVLPKLWWELVARKGEVTGVGIRTDDDMVVIKPYYEVIS